MLAFDFLFTPNHCLIHLFLGKSYSFFDGRLHSAGAFGIGVSWLNGAILGQSLFNTFCNNICSEIYRCFRRFSCNSLLAFTLQWCSSSAHSLLSHRLTDFTIGFKTTHKNLIMEFTALKKQVRALRYPPQPMDLYPGTQFAYPKQRWADHLGIKCQAQTGP